MLGALLKPGIAENSSSFLLAVLIAMAPGCVCGFALPNSLLRRSEIGIRSQDRTREENG
jgi:hypothetical protein